MTLSIHELHRDGSTLAVAVEGSLDGRTVADFARQLDELVGPETRRVVVDCTRVTMISSQGLGALLEVHKRLEQLGGEVCLAGTHGVPAMIIFMTRLDRIFRQFSDVDSAMRDRDD